MGLDEQLRKRLEALEGENKILKQEVGTLKANQTSKNPIRKGINSVLKTSTLGPIRNKYLYLPSSKLHPLGPKYGKRRLF